MGRLEILKQNAKRMKAQVLVVYYAYRDPKLPWLPRLIILLCLAYALSPIDLIPDFIPVIGYLDDLIVIPALIGLAMKLIPRSVMDEAKRRAEAEPLRLKNNWGFAVFFVILWLLLLSGLALLVIRLCSRQPSY